MPVAVPADTRTIVKMKEIFSRNVILEISVCSYAIGQGWQESALQVCGPLRTCKNLAWWVNEMLIGVVGRRCFDFG